MAYPPPPGHASLPPRPPPSSVGASSTGRTTSNLAKPAFTAFAPRTVASNSNTFRTNSPAQYSAPPVTSYASNPSYSPAQQSAYQAQPQYDASYQGAQATPQIRNPFVPTAESTSPNDPYGSYDPEYEAKVQQWQSAYMSKDDRSGSGVVKSVPSTGPPRTETPTQNVAQQPKTVQRSGGGATWTDSTLLEWDPAHFRIFVGNLAGEVTDESLLKAFTKYPSVQKARVIRDKRTTKSKGYGFVSFSDGDDYFQAAKEMQGKYIGSHPVLIKRAETEVRPSVMQNKKGKNQHRNKNSGSGQGRVEHGGVQKKIPKTKGGLRVLG